MSDPVTNVEIEDVLSSIRRLVSDGDKARTRDFAPKPEADEVAHDAGFEAAPEPESEPVDNLTDRLVLTPAFLVVDDAPKEETVFEPQLEENDDQDEALLNEDHSAPLELQDEDVTDPADGPEDKSQDEPASSDVGESLTQPLELRNMVWDTQVNDDVQVETIQTPDRSELVATIAELEAAISTGDDDFEPDGSEMLEGEPMAQTIAWPGTRARTVKGVEEAEAQEVAETVEDETSDDSAHAMQFQRSTTAAVPEYDVSPPSDVEAFDESEPDSSVEPTEAETDVYADDDIDDLIETGGATLDDEALRAVIAQVVREELAGGLGERLTRNVRKLVRREIYRALSSQELD